MRTTRVAVLRGGPSEEYDVSMKTGRAVIDALGRLRYPVKDVTISRQGEWLENGRARAPQQVLEAVDVVFLALHGSYGEDGQVQRVLERLRVPFTGSRGFASAFAFNKDLTKKQLKQYGVRMPEHMKLTREGVSDPYRTAQSILALFGPHYVIKPAASGSSIGTQIIRNSAQLAVAITHALTEYDAVMVEELIEGKEATVGVIEGFRGTKLYQLPPVEIVPPRDRFFDYEAKYTGITEEICPGRFSRAEKQLLQDLASLVHDRLGLSQYSRSDFIVKDGQPYFLEVNTLPGLTDESLMPKAVAAVGARYEDLVDHLVTTARA